MKDYWSKLKLNEQMSKIDRFNYIMDYIDEKLDDNSSVDSHLLKKGIVTNCNPLLINVPNVRKAVFFLKSLLTLKLIISTKGIHIRGF